MWKSVLGYEAIYDIDASGNVKRIGRGPGASLRILRWQRDRHGYPFVCLSKKGEVRQLRVHRLVIEAFKGPIPPNMQVNHIDGNKGNPCLDNLEVVTQSQNMLHAIHVLGLKRTTYIRGEQHHKAKVSAADVIEIRKTATADFTESMFQAIGDRYGITRQQIRRIVFRKSWAHI